MKTYNLNYRSDLKLTVDLGSNYEAGTPFKLVFQSQNFGHGYQCSYDGTNYNHCEMVDDSKVLCLLENHHLPCGKLFVEVWLLVSDSQMADGSLKLVSKVPVTATDEDGDTRYVFLYPGESDVVAINETVVNLLSTIIRGNAATIESVEADTLPAGSSATVSNEGTRYAAKLKFGIPKGEDAYGIEIMPSNIVVVLDKDGKIKTSGNKYKITANVFKGTERASILKGFTVSNSGLGVVSYDGTSSIYPAVNSLTCNLQLIGGVEPSSGYYLTAKITYDDNGSDVVIDNLPIGVSMITEPDVAGVNEARDAANAAATAATQAGNEAKSKADAAADSANKAADLADSAAANANEKATAADSAADSANAAATAANNAAVAANNAATSASEAADKALSAASSVDSAIALAKEAAKNVGATMEAATSAAASANAAAEGASSAAQVATAAASSATSAASEASLAADNANAAKSEADAATEKATNAADKASSAATSASNAAASAKAAVQNVSNSNKAAEAAAAAANAAATSADTAASNANQKAEMANSAANSANAAANKAEQASTTASNAAALAKSFAESAEEQANNAYNATASANAAAQKARDAAESTEDAIEQASRVNAKMEGTSIVVTSNDGTQTTTELKGEDGIGFTVSPSSVVVALNSDGTLKRQLFSFVANSFKGGVSTSLMSSFIVSATGLGSYMAPVSSLTTVESKKQANLSLGTISIGGKTESPSSSYSMTAKITYKSGETSTTLEMPIGVTLFREADVDGVAEAVDAANAAATSANAAATAAGNAASSANEAAEAANDAAASANEAALAAKNVSDADHAQATADHEQATADIAEAKEQVSADAANVAAMNSIVNNLISEGIGETQEYSLLFLEDAAMEGLKSTAMTSKILYCGLEALESGDMEISEGVGLFSNIDFIDGMAVIDGVTFTDGWASL